MSSLKSPLARARLTDQPAAASTSGPVSQLILRESHTSRAKAGSQNFPRANAFQNTFGGGSNDGFVAKVDEYPVATARGTDPDWMIRSLPLAVLTPNSSL